MATALDLKYFAVLDITYVPFINSLYIRTTTNNPSHLTCYYTDKQPVRHPTTLIKRGLAIPWGAYWCFVAWQSVEQQEPGDTLIHTFEIPNWLYCQVKWFTFRGTVNSELSPSVTAIIKKHHSFKLYEHFNEGLGGYSVSADPDTWFAQTFTPLETHNIVGVKLLLCRDALIGTITIRITPTNSEGKPLPAWLSSATTNGNTLPIANGSEWRYISLPEAKLPTGTKYAIVIFSQYAGLSWNSHSPQAYLRGNRVMSPDAGLHWFHSPVDNLFEEWGIPISSS